METYLKTPESMSTSGTALKSFSVIIWHRLLNFLQFLKDYLKESDNIFLTGSIISGSEILCSVGPAFLAHTKQKVSNIVDLTVLRLAFFMGYE